MNKHLLLALLLVLPLWSGAAQAQEPNPRVRMETTQGDIILELYPDKAPKTVANFLAYVKEGFYDGTIFHRVISGFMIQGGGFTADMAQKPTRPPIVNEADNGLRNTIGTIAMARKGDPHSASAQFFINVNNNTPLDFRDRTPRAWGYAVFGRVLKGIDVVKRIESAPTTRVGYFRDVPREPIIISRVSLLDADPAAKQE